MPAAARKMEPTTAVPILHVRNQPDTKITRWFMRRFANAGKGRGGAGLRVKEDRDMMGSHPLS